MEKLLEKQVKQLEKLENLAKTDKIIQLSSVMMERKIDQDQERESKDNIKKLEESQKLLISIADRLSETGPLAKQLQLLTGSLKGLTGKSKDSPKVADEQPDRKYIPTMAENIKGKIGAVKKFATGDVKTWRNVLDKTGIVKADSGGIFSNALKRADEKKDFIDAKMDKQSSTRELPSIRSVAKPFAQQTPEEQAATTKNVKRSAVKAYDADQAALRGDKAPKRVTKSAPSVEASPNTGVRKVAANDSNIKSNVVPIPTKLMGGDVSESESENIKREDTQTTLLNTIAENTKPPTSSSGAKESKAGAAPAGGLMDGIMGMFGEGFMTSLKTLFNPKTILKALGKVFVIGTIIGALYEGVMDGFNEFMKTGDIGKAIIAGLAGVVDFLTFGLFDKEKIKEVIGDMATWLNEHVVQPVVEFFTAMKDSFMGLLSKIGIPQITLLDNPVTGKVSVGPFYPFKSDAPKSSAPSPAPAAGGAAKLAPADPSTGTKIAAASADNDVSKNAKPAGGTSVIAPSSTVVNNSSSSYSMKPPIRNTDAGLSRHLAAKYA